MVAARVRVHAAGVFAPVTAALAAQTNGLDALLEAGAGPAHYLAHCLSGADAVGIALDVSTAAARVAARADQRIAAVVADVWQRLPLATASFDAVLCVFAPRNLPEFARVLVEGGKLLTVTPNPGHLAELRSRHQLLQIPADKQEGIRSEYFQLADSQRIRYPIDLPAVLADDLVRMGPNAFHAPPPVNESLRDQIDVTLSCLIRLPG
jgi:23S rRNA (guanine745-N1)-methyltransferase